MSSVKTQRTLGMFVLQLALILFFVVSGIVTLQLDSGIVGRIQASFQNNEVASAINSLIGNVSVANIVIILFGIVELLAGVFLTIRLFISAGTTFTKVLMAIIMIVWIIVILLVDILGQNGLVGGNVFRSLGSTLLFFKQFSAHLLVLGAVITVKD